MNFKDEYVAQPQQEQIIEKKLTKSQGLKNHFTILFESHSVIKDILVKSVRKELVFI